VGEGERAGSSKYEGEWVDDLMSGRGELEFYETSWDGFLEGGGREGIRVIRRFVGSFKKGFPLSGSLVTDGQGAIARAEGRKEVFDRVVFSGDSYAGDYAVWYWGADAEDDARGTRLIDLDVLGEEYRAVVAQFHKSMPAGSMSIASIQRVVNHEMRMIFDLQRRAVEKKVEAPPRSRPWNPRTMERWAFHAPGCGRSHPGAPARQHATPGNSWGAAANVAASPWESIVEEGFQATLAGSENGKAYGAGIYFARDAAYSDQYARRTTILQRQAASPGGGQHALAFSGGTLCEAQNLCRVFLTRIVTGIYTTGSPGMSQPPLDPAGAKGEHFHSLVNNVHRPGNLVVKARA
jgi:hypothetical protein